HHQAGPTILFALQKLVEDARTSEACREHLLHELLECLPGDGRAAGDDLAHPADVAQAGSDAETAQFACARLVIVSHLTVIVVLEVDRDQRSSGSQTCPAEGIHRDAVSTLARPPEHGMLVCEDVNLLRSAVWACRTERPEVSRPIPVEGARAASTDLLESRRRD